MILRAKTKLLFQGKELTEQQQKNTDLNLKEIENGATVLSSLPRRLVFELTNACNLNCVMCGRNAADFKGTMFSMDWFRYFEPMLDTVEEVTLMGWGEPTMHPQFEEMLKIIDKHSARKYFCTNGMKLDKLTDAIFENHVDVFAVSLDGGTAETNNRIRRGSDIEKITNSLINIERIKKERGLNYPWINFVFCAMKSNLHELPDLVRLAHKTGIDEVKVVFLTAFDDNLAKEILWDCQDEVKKVFEEAVRLGDELGIAIKLPYVQGEDVAGDKMHKDCFVAWRDFFLGSDGFIRPCMSTPIQFDKFDVNKPFMDFWNAEYYKKYRKIVNDPDNMDDPCKRCYQSSHCNWNRKVTWLQTNQEFSPKWKKEI
jgi:radical SAM protein with 4Fe4S-binding SPASM domain